MKKKLRISVFAIHFILAAPVWAQESLPSSAPESQPTVYRTPVIEVIGSNKDSLDEVPGSGEVLGATKLKIEEPISLQEALRGVPGVHLRSEDGIGLLPNIGIRGLNPDRSEKVLILEDGVPAGLAPYTVNAAYYIPPIERIDRVEILKGSGSILYGPQTVGGVINLITPDVPKESRSRFRFDGGTDAYVMGYGSFGKTWGPFGIDASILHKQGNGFRDASEFNLTNINAKMKFDVAKNTKLILKTNFQDQHSSQTYLGLTQNLYEANPDFNPAPFDRFALRRFDTLLTLQHFFTDDIELLTNIYYANTRRDWNRQDFFRNNNFGPPPENTSAVYGDTSIDGGAVYMQESFGSRDRDFQYFGVVPRLKMDYKAFGKKHLLQAGMRFHWEELLDERNNRETYIAAPVTRDRDLRRAYAFSLYFQNTFRVTDHLSLIPGFRLEQYTQTRDITRSDNADVDFSNSTSHTVPIPGFGITYDLPRQTVLFAGLHRGFAPPRTAQAISSTGEDVELKPETSWNYELGVRTNPFPWWRGEATFFYMDFGNQVLTAAEAGGSTTSEVDAGQTRHIGVEFANSIDLLGLAGRGDAHQLYLDAQYTFVDTENTTSGGFFEGKELPYAPNHLLQVGLRYAAQEGRLKGLTLGMEGLFTGEQFTDQVNTREPSNDGTVGLIPSYWIFNSYVRYKVPKTRLELSLIANNMFNNNYIVSRSPQGIFPGPGLQVLGGLRYDLF